MSAPAPIFPYSSLYGSIDLTTLQAVKDYMGTAEGAIVAPGADNADDTVIQAIITGLSQYWLNQTGRASLNSVLSYNEFYDGGGSPRLFLDNYPIVSVQSLVVNNITIPQSTAVGQGGWFIERSQKSLALRPTGAGGLNTTVGYPGYGFAYNFYCGIGNVQVQYMAGYNGIPNDIFEAVAWQASQAYKKREQINLESMQMGGGTGGANYVKWDWTPEIRSVLNSYKKIAISPL